MLIGLDFDNTIASYDRLFRQAGIDAGWLPADFSGGKVAVRAAVRARPEGAADWMRLQGRVYGPLMQGADPMPGVHDFVRACQVRGVRLTIVSHKTPRGHFDETGTDLRAVARRWLVGQGLVGGRFGMSAEAVFFEPTREEKMQRIAALGCSHFVDDLIEMLDDLAFPRGVEKLLLQPDDRPVVAADIRVCRDWHEVGRHVFGCDVLG